MWHCVTFMIADLLRDSSAWYKAGTGRAKLVTCLRTPPLRSHEQQQKYRISDEEPSYLL